MEPKESLAFVSWSLARDNSHVTVQFFCWHLWVSVESGLNTQNIRTHRAFKLKIDKQDVAKGSILLSPNTQKAIKSTFTAKLVTQGKQTYVITMNLRGVTFAYCKFKNRPLWLNQFRS